jgi:hypothetical protein
MKISAKMASILAEVQSDHLPNTSPKYYSYASFIAYTIRFQDLHIVTHTQDLTYRITEMCNKIIF